MISKERLEELIGQKKSIYWKFAKIKPSSWSKYTIMGNTIVKGNLKEIYSLDDLFETKEDFEWHRQFGCITRTERLELPTWEEFSKWDKSIKFYNNSTKYSMYVFVKNKNTKNCRIIIYADNGEQDWFVFEQPLTQENYLKACRKCKELFLGGSDGDIR